MGKKSEIKDILGIIWDTEEESGKRETLLSPSSSLFPFRVSMGIYIWMCTVCVVTSPAPLVLSSCDAVDCSFSGLQPVLCLTTVVSTREERRGGRAQWEGERKRRKESFIRRKRSIKWKGKCFDDFNASRFFPVPFLCVSVPWGLFLSFDPFFMCSLLFLPLFTHSLIQTIFRSGRSFRLLFLLDPGTQTEHNDPANTRPSFVQTSGREKLGEKAIHFRVSLCSSHSVTVFSTFRCLLLLWP